MNTPLDMFADITNPVQNVPLDFLPEITDHQNPLTALLQEEAETQAAFAYYSNLIN